MRGSWRPNRTATYWPPLFDHQRCVFLFLQGCSTRGPLCWVLFFLPHLVTNGSGLQTDLQTNWLPVFTELYNSSISLEWHVWSSSSRNNCHAVHWSLSSGASVYECTMVFYLVPYCQSSLLMRFLPITAIGMCHFLPLHHFGMACLAGSKVNIQHAQFKGFQCCYLILIILLNISLKS